jgi:hypothetical protein
MHIKNESAEIMTIGEHEFKEIVEEYEEEILMQEKVPKAPLTNAVDTAPDQGKPRCITLIFYKHRICVCVVHLRCRNFMETPCIYIYPMSLTSVGSSSCYA